MESTPIDTAPVTTTSTEEVTQALSNLTTNAAPAAANPPSSAAKKNKKKKKKASASTTNASTQEDNEDERDNAILEAQYNRALSYSTPTAALKAHAFWDTQPVPKIDEKTVDVNEWIEAPKDPKTEIRQEPLDLISAFEWSDMEINDEKELGEIYTLLSQNYVEDDDQMFRFDYSTDFLKWALAPPGYRKDWHLGVRQKSNQKLVAFITAIPALTQIRDKEVPMVEINFLCVHKRLRAHRLAPVLIKEITRRVNVTGVFQAVYTAGVVLPKPIACCRYFHRSLNPKKLIEVGFSHLAPRMTMARTIHLYRLEKNPLTPGIRAMEKKDIAQVTKLVTTYLKNFQLYTVFNEEEIAHWLLPRRGVIYSYVVEDPATKKITDFCSFYSLPSSILNNPTHSTLNAAYSYYNVAEKTDLTQLIQDALILARNENFDVYNALDILQNQAFLKPLKFGVGDGNLQYYLYNWRSTPLQPADVGLVLL